eukprot:g31162.t1
MIKSTNQQQNLSLHTNTDKSATSMVDDGPEMYIEDSNSKKEKLRRGEVVHGRVAMIGLPVLAAIQAWLGNLHLPGHG